MLESIAESKWWFTKDKRINSHQESSIQMIVSSAEHSKVGGCKKDSFTNVHHFTIFYVTLKSLLYSCLKALIMTSSNRY